MKVHNKPTIDYLTKSVSSHNSELGKGKVFPESSKRKLFSVTRSSCSVYDQHFRGGGGAGMVDGEGCSSERCLMWGGGGSLRDLSKNILKQGWVKEKVVRMRRGF